MPTQEGIRLRERSKDIFAAVAQISPESIRDDTGVSGQVTIASHHSLAVSILPRLLSKVRSKAPAVQIRVKVGNSAIIRELLREREADFAFGVSDDILSDFPRIKLRTGRFVLVERAPSVRSINSRKPTQSYNERQSGQASRSHSRLPWFKRGNFIVGDRGIEVAQLKAAYRAFGHGALPVCMEIQSWDVIQALAVEGLGVGLVPDYVLGNTRGLQLAQLGDFQGQSYELSAFFLQRAQLSPGTKAVLNELKELSQEPKRP